MGILQGSKADVLQNQPGLSTTLDADVDLISGSPIVLPNFSVNLTVPGTYQLTCNVMTITEVSAGDGVLIAAFFKDTPIAENTLVNSFVAIGSARQLNVSLLTTASLISLVTITKPTLIGVLAEAKSFTGAAVTFTTALVFADTVNVGFGNLQAIQLIN